MTSLSLLAGRTVTKCKILHILARLYGLTSWIESYLVANPEEWFSPTYFFAYLNLEGLFKSVF